MNEPIDELKTKRQLKALRATWQRVLDADADTVHTDIAERLQAARARALSAPSAREDFSTRVFSRHYGWWLAPAAAAVLVIAVWLPTRTMNAPVPDALVPADAIGEVAVWQEESELLDELDFYTWLEMEADHAS